MLLILTRSHPVPISPWRPEAPVTPTPPTTSTAENPYHNKTHAADVLQSMHVLLTRGGLGRRLGEELALLSGYLAAIVGVWGGA